VSVYNAIYLSLICCALMLAIKSFISGRKKSLYILLVLLATLLVEMYSTIAIAYHVNFSWTYHLFSPIEYSLFCVYYLAGFNSNKFKSIIVYSIPFFITFSLLISIFLYQFQSMPAININVEGVLLFMLYTHLLFCIDVDLNTPIYSHPDFWISIGVLMFFGGVFIFLGLYPFLFNLNFKETMRLFDEITRPLNIIFYSCIIIGLLCSIQKRKYFIS
jgi:hypothetical protein